MILCVVQHQYPGDSELQRPVGWTAYLVRWMPAYGVAVGKMFLEITKTGQEKSNRNDKLASWLTP